MFVCVGVCVYSVISYHSWTISLNSRPSRSNKRLTVNRFLNNMFNIKILFCAQSCSLIWIRKQKWLKDFFSCKRFFLGRREFFFQRKHNFLLTRIYISVVSTFYLTSKVLILLKLNWFSGKRSVFANQMDLNGIHSLRFLLRFQFPGMIDLSFTGRKAKCKKSHLTSFVFSYLCSEGPASHLNQGRVMKNQLVFLRWSWVPELIFCPVRESQLQLFSHGSHAFAPRQRPNGPVC